MGLFLFSQGEYSCQIEEKSVERQAFAKSGTGYSTGLKLSEIAEYF